MRDIKGYLVRKCVQMLADISEKEDYHQTVCEQFGECLRLRIHENSNFRTKIASLVPDSVRAVSKDRDDEQYISESVASLCGRTLRWSME